MNRAEEIALINSDVASEHAAIVQYLSHAFAVGETALGYKLKEMAREEMWHMKWLSEGVVRLGGEPTLRRGEYAVDYTSNQSVFDSYVTFEQNVVTNYEQHMNAVSDPRLKRVYWRIIVESAEHRDEVAAILAKMGDEIHEPPPFATRPAVDVGADDLLHALGVTFQEEYRALLQHLRHSFLTSARCPFSRQLEEQAIDSMRHVDLLAEELSENGALPVFEHGPVDNSADVAGMLRANLNDLKTTRKLLADLQAKAGNDGGLAGFLRVMENHKDYHADTLRDMLAELQPNKPNWTIGSLKTNQD